MKDLFYALSDNSMYRRFFSSRKDMPHERLQEFVVIDYSREVSILATIFQDEKEIIVGIGQYIILPNAHVADIAFVVRDEYQNKGIGNELLSYLTYLARKQGLLGFVAEVLMENRPMLHLFEKMGFFIDKKLEGDSYELRWLLMRRKRNEHNT